MKKIKNKVARSLLILAEESNLDPYTLHMRLEGIVEAMALFLSLSRGKDKIMETLAS